MKTLHILPAAAAVLSLLVLSCNKDNTLVYGATEMGVVRGGLIIADSGNIYRVAEQECAGQIDTMSRILFYCDILSQTGDNSYDIRLRGITEPPVIDPVPAPEDPVSLTDDPARVVSAWFGGGYFNLGVYWFSATSSAKKHDFALSWSQSSPTDTLRLRLYHEGYGENYGVLPQGSLQSNSGYLCFPMSDIPVASGQTVPVLLTWTWHTTTYDTILEETRTYSEEGSYTR